MHNFCPIWLAETTILILMQWILSYLILVRNAKLTLQESKQGVTFGKYATCGKAFWPSSINIMNQAVTFGKYAKCGKIFLWKLHYCFVTVFSTCGNGGRSVSPSSMNIVQQGVKFDNYVTCGKMLLSKFHECSETESSFHMWV